MLIDPDVFSDLEGGEPFTTKTLDFVKSLVRGIHYVEATVDEAQVSCQVLTGDGVLVEETQNAVIRIANQSGDVVISTGTALQGASTATCWATTSSGELVFSIAGMSGDTLVEIQVDRCLPAIVLVTVPAG